MNKLFGNYKLKLSDELMKPLFMQAYFLAKENIATLKFENLKKQCEELEVD